MPKNLMQPPGWTGRRNRKARIPTDDFFEEGWSSGQCDIGEDGDEYVKPGWYESLLYSEQLLEIEDEVIGWMPIPEYQ